MEAELSPDEKCVVDVLDNLVEAILKKKISVNHIKTRIEDNISYSSDPKLNRIISKYMGDMSSRVIDPFYGILIDIADGYFQKEGYGISSEDIPAHTYTPNINNLRLIFLFVQALNVMRSEHNKKGIFVHDTLRKIHPMLMGSSCFDIAHSKLFKAYFDLSDKIAHALYQYDEKIAELFPEQRFR